MAEYIEREAAIATALDAVEIHPSQVDCLKEALSEIPAADVRPVAIPKKWLSTSEYCSLMKVQPSGICIFWYCSICARGNQARTNFCPNCGADMREEGANGETSGAV